MTKSRILGGLVSDTGLLGGGTANGVAYLNGSKVLTTGSALTFDGSKLTSVNTGFAINSFADTNGAYAIKYGANASSRSWRIGSDLVAYGDFVLQQSTTRTGSMFQSVYNALNDGTQFWSVGGSEQMRLTSTGLGIGTNLGVGVASPTLRIQAAVSGATTTFDGLGVTNGTATFRLGLTGATYSYAGVGANEVWLYSSSTTPLTLGPDGNGPIKFVSNGSEQMRLTSTGLGIGTSSPAQKLDVRGVQTATIRVGSTGSAASGDEFGNLEFYWADEDAPGVKAKIYAKNTGNVGPGGGGAADLLFATMPAFGSITERMRIDSSGNLGLGVTPTTGGYGRAFQFSDAPADQLMTLSSQSINTDDRRLSITNNAKSSGTYTWAYYNTGPSANMYQQGGGQHRWYNAPPGTAGNAISFTQAMTLESGGNLLVGVTSTTPGNARGFSVTSVGAGEFRVFHSTTDGSGDPFGRFIYNGTQIGSITQSGTTGVLYNVTSDQRLKENIVDAPEFGGVIDSIKVRSYDWKTDQTHQRAGFVAQELVTVAPEAVHQPADPEAMMAVDYSKLVPMLVKEIQSLRQRLAAAGI